MLKYLTDCLCVLKFRRYVMRKKCTMERNVMQLRKIYWIVGGMNQTVSPFSRPAV